MSVTQEMIQEETDFPGTWTAWQIAESALLDGEIDTARQYAQIEYECDDLFAEAHPALFALIKDTI